jgi:hypothetical protein
MDYMIQFHLPPQYTTYFGNIWPNTQLLGGWWNGRKIIQLIKPLWNGFCKNWQLNLVDNVLRKMAIDRIEKHNINCLFDSSQQSVKAGKQYHRYKNKSEVYDTFNNCQVMSMIQLNNGNFIFAVMGNTYVHVMCTTYFQNLCGFHYHYWHIINNDCEVDYFEIKCCCLLLPLLTSTGLPTSDDESIYTVIDLDWKNIQADKSFSAPKIEDIL